MSSDLEHDIQKKIHALPEEQQRHVLSVIEDLLRKPVAGKYSFIGIGHSGQGDLSSRAEEILEESADRREGWSLRE